MRGTVCAHRLTKTSAGKLEFIVLDRVAFWGVPMRWFVVAGLSGATLCCSDGSGPEKVAGPVRVQPAETNYRPGNTVQLTITNLSSGKLQYTACFFELERLEVVHQWQVVHQEENPCPAVLEYLDPFQSREASVVLPENLQMAAHRVRFPAIGVRQGDEEPFVTAIQVGDSFTVVP